VSIWVKEMFIKELIKLEEYRSKNYEAALKTIFRKMDTLMLEPAGAQRLREI